MSADAQATRAARADPRGLVPARAVKLASGKESDFYLDLRQTLMRPRGVALAGELVLRAPARRARVDAVGGMAVGAVPLVAAVLAAAARTTPGSKLLGFFVRKEEGARPRPPSRAASSAGQSVALVEDTVTTGGSTLEALAAVEAEGGKVARVLCLVDRGEGARGRVRGARHRARVAVHARRPPV